MAKVILITWQSNAQGRANSNLATPLELEAKNKCLIWNNDTNSFQPLKIGAYANNQSSPSLHGVELPLAMQFLNESPDETIYIIKYAEPGTNIDFHLPGGSTYEKFNNDFVIPAINWLLQNEIEPEIYFYLSGGEADSTNARYKDFSFKLSQLTNHYRSILSSEIQFIFPLIIESGSLERDSEINNVFKNFSKNDAKVSVIHSVDYETDDNLHWNYTGVNRIGSDLFQIIKNTKGGKVEFPLPYDFNSGYVDVVAQDKKYISELDYENSNVLNFPFQNKGFVYIDTELSNSDKSCLNNRFRPYHNLQSAINALPTDNNFTWQIYFLKGGVIDGCALPFRNLEFYSEKAVTIDFTNVNHDTSVISPTNVNANSFNIIEYKFLSNNITLKSDYTGVQRFTNESPYLKISGNVALNWKSSGGSNSNHYIFQCRQKTDLVIREWYTYSTHGAYILGFADGSNICFEKIINVDLNNKYTFRQTNFNILHNANVEIKELNMQAGEFRSLVPISINKITGNGVINSKSTKFNECVCSSGVSFNMINLEKLQGVLISTNPITGTVSSLLKIRDFEGKINALNVTGSIECYGNNEIETTSLISNINTNFVIKNGITVVNGNLSANVTERGVLKINI